jgi:hypothetical protein
VGWGYALIEMLIGPITMVLFGYLVASVTQSEFNWPFTATWVIFMIVAALVIAGLNFRGVQISARTGTVLGAIEIIVFLVHRARHRQVGTVVRLAAVLPDQRDRAGHRDLVRDRRRGPDLPVRPAPRAAAEDAAGVLR